MLNRFLSRLLPFLFSACFTIVSCGPSPEEKARQQALRDSASVDSALRVEIKAAREKNKQAQEKTSALKDSASKAKKARLDSLKGAQRQGTDSLNQTEHAQKPAISPPVHKLSAMDSIKLRRIRHELDSARMSRIRMHRDSLKKGTLKPSSHRDSLVAGLVIPKTHKDSVYMGIIRKKLPARSDSIRRRRVRDSVLRARRKDTSQTR